MQRFSSHSASGRNGARQAARTRRVNCALLMRSHSGERLNEYLRGSSHGLFVLFHEVSVGVYFKSRLFTVRFDEHLVIPLTIGIVFP